MNKGRFSDTEIIHALKNRSIAAFEQLYTSSRVWLYGIAYSILQDETTAKDLVQDFFSDLWEYKLYDHIGTSVNGYLLVSVKNRAFNHKKAIATERKLKANYIYPADYIAPTLKMEQDQLRQAIDAALKKVPKASAESFILHYIEGLSHAQVAEKQNISHHTVRNQISFALKILRKELKNLRND